jgi:hypothetical protein
MVITAGPISLARPGWGLETGTVTTLVTDGTGGYPEVLAAQMLCSAAVSGAKTLMLLPYQRSDDDVWKAMVSLLAGGDPQSASRELRRLPITLHTGGTGWEKVERADLVYVPRLSPRNLRRIKKRVAPPVLVVDPDFDDGSRDISNRVIRVSCDALVVDGEGFEVPVVYDSSGPIYRPA